jgi:thiamine pyrophosphate-dependent acetolactate synthase large subunit-like protein
VDAAQFALPITFVILKNRRYAALQEFAPTFGFGPNDELPGTELPGIDFVALARAQGCDAVTVSWRRICDAYAARPRWNRRSRRWSRSMSPERWLQWR